MTIEYRHISLKKLQEKDQIFLETIFAQQLRKYKSNSDEFKIRKIKENATGIKKDTWHDITIKDKKYRIFLDKTFNIIRYGSGYLFIPIARKIGKGTFGTVKRLNQQNLFFGGFNDDNNQNFICTKINIPPKKLGTCKIIKFKESESDEGSSTNLSRDAQYQVWQNEVRQEVDFNNQVRKRSMEAPIFIQDKAYLFGSYYLGKNLMNFVRSNNSQSEETIQAQAIDRFMIAQSVLEELAVIHKTNIAHSDIKLSNILFEQKSNRTTIIDFGLSAVKDTRAQIGGTPCYVAPELVIEYCESRGLVSRTQAADVFSMGVCLVEILGINIIEEFEQGYEINPKRITDLLTALDEQYDRISENYSLAKPLIRNLITSMLTSDPEDRPTAAAALTAVKDINNRIKIAKQLDKIINKLESKKTATTHTKEQALKALKNELFRSNETIDKIFDIWEKSKIDGLDFDDKKQRYKNNLQILSTRRTGLTSSFWNHFRYPSSLQSYLKIKKSIIKSLNKNVYRQRISHK